MKDQKVKELNTADFVTPVKKHQDKQRVVHRKSKNRGAGKHGFSESNPGIFEKLLPIKKKVVHHEVFELMGQGELPLKEFRKTLLNFYPLVENFPKFMALNLAKTRCHKPGHEEAKQWLIANIAVEQNHAKWYRGWAEGFGISEEEITHVKPTPAMEAVVNYLWKTNEMSTVPVCFSATNVGIEWATGEWSKKVEAGVKSYLDKGLIDGNRKIMAWLKAHTNYDDKHPYEAMELVLGCAENETELNDSLEAAERSLEYYKIALDDCLK
ncbi:MAG: iron-containing redox enzyme family protein [Nitrospina sp.]|nr:iron-containing redox enzyme family protein [Nitrospina sp.]MBT4105210.1 iron-containing redox enzyme family protein [Nitrospina sp.]MBT5261910.1 iron-containing redox enzyme family protein [Nitrospina sp.]MBT5763880.1 iron-containing redox enzyme family protein [Nitrospina sp.]MBT7178938.1 iron-containing redox enzyme family protein [Nitrospina sp.]